MFNRNLKDYLKENKAKEALDLFKNTSDDIIRDSSWPTIHTVSSYITDENAEHNREMFDCCKMILYDIAERFDPSDTLHSFLEEMEDDIRFCTILEIISKNVLKVKDKLKIWCINTIKSYIEELSAVWEETEQVTTATNRILKVHNSMILFLEIIVQEAALQNAKSESYAELRDQLLSALICLMGEPLCYLPDHILESRSEQPLPEKIVILMNHITGDLLQFLNIMSIRSKKHCPKKKTMDEESYNIKKILFESDENVSDLAYANLYFYILTKPHLWEKVPQIYNWQYIFEACIYLIIKLLQEKEKVTVEKGLNLMDHLLNRLTKHCLISELLELNIYSNLFDAIVNVMIYYDSDKERRKALELFQKYVEMFDVQARYHVVLRLYQTSEHSGLLSLTSSILKDSIIECLQTTPPIPYFLGDNLKTLLKLICKLSHGSGTDLVEISDEIISSLNLLRFLVIRDRHNQTGIWNVIDDLRNDFLKPLREAINLCKAHWKVKIKDLEEQKKIIGTSDMGFEKSDAEIALIVGGEKLPPLPLSEKILFCHKAVNGLDVMESILIRVNECISETSFTKTNDNAVTSK
ncbi:ubiquinone biosynthesis protein COQ9, mitochondrial isoform X1 [Lasioglossum baleicum]|uniref:ubiquinone biosynthesis protein COQ9, mitochondrial isoform X1 n=1 Tax=Lasioglossum baleicum TaxID=434251 RepID=UPI003FCD5D2D